MGVRVCMLFQSLFDSNEIVRMNQPLPQPPFFQPTLSLWARLIPSKSPAQTCILSNISFFDPQVRGTVRAMCESAVQNCVRRLRRVVLRRVFPLAAFERQPFAAPVEESAELFCVRVSNRVAFLFHLSADWRRQGVVARRSGRWWQGSRAFLRPLFRGRAPQTESQCA